MSGCNFVSIVPRATGASFSSPRHVVTNKHPVGKDARLAVLWVGHAAALVQIDEKVILTDPVFTSSVGPLATRLVDPGLDPKELPPVDAALISHLRYDHLSLGSIATIQSKVRTMPMPRGGTAYVTDFGFPVYELRTWQA